MISNSELKYMKLALRLAEKAKDKTYPNPMVGAVIVKKNKIIGKGYHRKAGKPHAEVEAIRNASEHCRGAVLFVTLEPCDHYGKTPPCTEAIIKSGIKKVYVPIKDPNPLNRGRGIKKLRRAGIKVECGLCADEAKDINRKYIKYIKSGLPYVTLKLAESLDGKIAASDGSSKWISTSVARKYVRKMRSRYNAVMVGSNTVYYDNPFLLDEKKKGYGTFRVIVDSALKISLNSNLIKTASKSPVIIGTTEFADKTKKGKLCRINGVSVVSLKSKHKKVPLKAFLKCLAAKGIVNMFVEGGGELAGSLIDECLADEVMFFIAPKIIGGTHFSIKGKGSKNITKAIDLKDVQIKKFGTDIFVHGYINK
ncbi:MAG: bifunctional diaminohydroxyphosphoribosylaminopyrimidine deaminase/5-amino-6-(5-phosphoribosylamino)uracil reductase RibD [Candidatus Omnitrophota bacterium]